MVVLPWPEAGALISIAGQLRGMEEKVISVLSLGDN